MTNNELIMEVRGSMTRFDPLTPELVTWISDDKLTYDELAEILDHYGFTIKNVVHDPGRRFQHTYYADYDNGIYFDVSMMSREYFDFVGKDILQGLSKMLVEGSQLLSQKEWDSFYLIMMPLPMAVYDFQKRFRDIPTDQVFDVWYGIYKRLDYSFGMWEPDVLEYVFSYPPDTPKPEANENGLVTIYRGMGELSSNPDQAISWSTHPGNALWFANRFHLGTALVIAEVDPGAVVAYYPSFRNENEVIVKPGTVQNIRSADMLPADQENFIKLAAPALFDYMRYGRQARKLGYKKETGFFEYHGIKHILRVLFLALVYYHSCKAELTERDKEILVYFALLHDVGRINEDVDDNHGAASVSLIKSKGLRVQGVNLSKKDYRIAHLIIEYHCKDDGDGISAIRNTEGFTRNDKHRAERLYKICKDMDGLDRVRFNGLDYRMLRTEFARKLPLIAGCLLNEDVVGFLDNEIHDEGVSHND